MWKFLNNNMHNDGENEVDLNPSKQITRRDRAHSATFLGLEGKKYYRINESQLRVYSIFAGLAV